MRKTNYKNPTDSDNTAWKFGAGIDLPYFTWMQTQEDRQRAFANHMRFKSSNQNWYNTVLSTRSSPPTLTLKLG